MRRGKLFLLFFTLVLSACRADRSALSDLLGLSAGQAPHYSPEEPYDPPPVSDALWTLDIQNGEYDWYSAMGNSGQTIFGLLSGNLPRLALISSEGSFINETFVDDYNFYSRNAASKNSQTYAVVYGQGAATQTVLRIADAAAGTTCSYEFGHQPANSPATISGKIRVSVTDDGSLVAASTIADGYSAYPDSPGVTRIFDKNCQELAEISTDSLVNEMQWSAGQNGQRNFLLLHEWDGNIRKAHLYDHEQGQILVSLEESSERYEDHLQATLSSDGSTLAVVYESSFRHRVDLFRTDSLEVDLIDYQIDVNYEIPASIFDGCFRNDFSEDGNTFMVNCVGETVFLLDVSNDPVLEFSFDGYFLAYLSDSGDKIVHIQQTNWEYGLQALEVFRKDSDGQWGFERVRWADPPTGGWTRSIMVSPGSDFFVTNLKSRLQRFNF